MVKYYLAVFILLCMLPVYSQKTAQSTLGSWHLVSVTGKVSDRFDINSSIQARYYEQLKNFNQFVFRAGINYHFNPHILTNLGYGYIATDTTFEENINEVYKKEQTIGEQIVLKDIVGRFEFEHRVWLEQRFIEADNQGILHRARYRLQLNLPIDKIFFLNFHEEVFLNLQDEVWGQNRLYGSMGAHVFPNLTMQAGYFRTYNNHTHLDRLRIAVFYNPDLRKKAQSKTL